MRMTRAEFLRWPHKAITLLGMSGVGKTTLAYKLPRSKWFHYSGDYRIGTKYLAEPILDNIKEQAMQVPFLRDLLRTDSIKMSSAITFSNLAPLSTYLGRPGSKTRGGLELDEYRRRQEQHRVAEIAALQEVPLFIQRAHDLYGYDNFIADTGGSLIEVVDHTDANDPVIKALTQHTALLYIRGTEADAEKLVSRFRHNPKPMYYQPPFLTKKWQEFKALNKVANDSDVDPDAFGAWGFEALLHDRLPRYQALADNFGYTVEATDLATVRDGADFIGLMGKAIANRMR